VAVACTSRRSTARPRVCGPARAGPQAAAGAGLRAGVGLCTLVVYQRRSRRIG